MLGGKQLDNPKVLLLSIYPTEIRALSLCLPQDMHKNIHSDFIPNSQKKKKETKYSFPPPFHIL